MTRRVRLTLVALAAGLCTAVSASTALADGLNVYCPMSEIDCQAILDAFKSDTGIGSQFVRLGAGEIVARIRAEKDNPQAGLWLAGAADNFIQAAGEGLLAPHKSARVDEVNQHYVDKDHFWTPISTMPLAFVYNAQLLEEINAEPPTSWKSFADPMFDQNIALAHPAASGTAYVAVATMVQLYGEDAAFTLMKEIDKNVIQYTRSGTAPSRMVGSEEVALAIAFSSDVELGLKNGYPLSYAFPEEGTGFEVNAAALIANAPQDQARDAVAFLDWILGPSGQSALASIFRAPLIGPYDNPEAKVDIGSTKLIDYDFAWAGENRARLLERYENEVRHKADAQ